MNEIRLYEYKWSQRLEYLYTRYSHDQYWYRRHHDQRSAGASSTTVDGSPLRLIECIVTSIVSYLHEAMPRSYCCFWSQCFESLATYRNVGIASLSQSQLWLPKTRSHGSGRPRPYSASDGLTVENTANINIQGAIIAHADAPPVSWLAGKARAESVK